jgi:hypothetical protein
VLEGEMSDGGRALPLEPAEYAALSNFLRGYLHQDAAVEYGSPAAAARVFRKDVDQRETAIVHAELERLLATTEAAPFPELAQILQVLGSSWRFESRNQVEQLRDALK